MSEFTLEELVVVLRECAGEDESVDLDGDIIDTTLGELGYDSLALLNTLCRVERERGIELPDGLIRGSMTPRELINEVNSRLVRV